MSGSPASESGEYWTVALQGREVLRLTIDYALTLELHGETEYEGSVRIAHAFTLRQQSGRVFAIDPANTRELGPVLECFGKTVEQLRIWKPDGRLVLTFTDGTEIEAQPNAEYEAWEVNAPGLKMIAMPGGGEPAMWF